MSELREAWIEFKDHKCHVCGARKAPKMAFCKQCYWKLPKPMQSALWRVFGSGFEEAYAIAKKWLIERRTHAANANT